MPVRVGTESAPCSPAVIPAGSAAAGSTTVNSGWRARNAAICCWFSAGSMVQVEYTSLPPAFSGWETVLLGREAIRAALQNGEIVDAKTLIGLQYWLLNS